MIRISDVIREIMAGNSILQMGLYHRLLNLSQVAKFIQPMVEAHAKKEVKVSAIVMNLSRYQRQVNTSLKPQGPDFAIEHITVHSDLCTLTFFKTKEIHTKINSLYNEIQKQHGFLTITEGVNEITIILDKRFMPLVRGKIAENPRFQNDSLASVAVKFSNRYLTTPGLLYLILQQVVLQNINIVELSSTCTEFIMYVDQKDTRLVFDTLYNRFSR